LLWSIFKIPYNLVKVSQWESIKKSAFRRFGRYSSAVRIAGVTHEFSTIPGVREDILEILLNLKGIVVKQNTRH
jgi:hypothetical protein